MKTEITAKDYKDIYEACGWDSKSFSIVLKRLGYSDELIVDGNLDLMNSPIKSLVNVKEVNGYLDLRSAPIQSLGSLQHVSGYLNLNRAPIQDLGNLQKVGFYLGLSNTPIQDLGSLQYVGSHFYLFDTPLSKKYTEMKITQMVRIKGEIYK